MKNILYIFIGTLLFTACSNLVEGLNNNPNSPTSAPFQNILTGAQVGSIILQSGENARRAGIFAGYYTGIDRQHEGFSNYTVTTSDFDDLWDDVYINAIRNAKVAESQAISENIGGISIGITQVLQAQALGTAASLYGDIPFDDAALFEVENPVYENQIEVFNKIQGLLDQAISNLQSGSGRPSNNADIFFNGEPIAWAEVANTLKARYYMVTKEYDKAYTAATVGIQSMANSMYAPHSTAADASNLSYQFFAVYVRAADLVTSDFMTSLVAPDAITSPDINNYRGNAKTNEAGRYNFYFQITGVGTQPNTSADGWADQTASAPLVTFEENILILSEAGFRTNGFAAGLTHLNDFRLFMGTGGYMTNPDMANVQYDAYNTADFSAGGMENLDNVSQDNALLREILEERYVTFFGQTEGFNDTRRTEKETIVRVPVMPNTGSELPQRFLYPQTEIDRNSNTPNPIPGFFAPMQINQ